MMPSYPSAPWPTERSLKRSAPGIAVIGRCWVNLKPDSIPYLVANLFVDLPRQFNAISVAVIYSVSDEGQYVCSLRVKRFLCQLQPYFSIKWHDMSHYTQALFEIYRERDRLPTQYIEFYRDGFYTQTQGSLAMTKSS